MYHQRERIPMITPPQIYNKIEASLETAYPLMVLLSLVLIGVTLVLLYRRNPLALAAWLTYMYMP